jgi:hypothetical protein
MGFPASARIKSALLAKRIWRWVPSFDRRGRAFVCDDDPGASRTALGGRLTPSQMIPCRGFPSPHG